MYNEVLLIPKTSLSVRKNLAVDIIVILKIFIYVAAVSICFSVFNWTENVCFFLYIE